MTKRAGKPETALQSAIVKALRAFGCTVHRLHSGKVRVRGGWLQLEEEGTPDLLCLHLFRQPGCYDDMRVVYLETKTATGELSDVQHSMHVRIRRAGGKVYTVRTPREALEAVRGG